MAPREEDAIAVAQRLFQSGEHRAAIESMQAVVDESRGSIEERRLLARMLNMRGYRFTANQQLRVLAGRAPLSFDELAGLVYPMRPYITFREKPDIEDPQSTVKFGVMSMVAVLRSRGDVRDALDCLGRSGLANAANPECLATYGWLLALCQKDAELVHWALESDFATCSQFPAYWIALSSLAVQVNDPSAFEFAVEALRREPGSSDAIASILHALKLRQASGDAEAHRWWGRFDARRLALSEIGWLTNEIGAESIDGELIERLSQRLSDIGRPLEALCWHQLALLYLAPQSQQLRELEQLKQQVISRFPSGRDESEIVCGWSQSQPDAVEFLAKLRAGEGESKAVPATDSPRSMAGDQPVAAFTNVANAVGLEFQYRNAVNPVTKNFRLYESLGAGVACLDFELDGQLDFYFAQAGGDPGNGVAGDLDRLMRQTDGAFVDRTEPSRAIDRAYSLGVTAGDLNQDGFPDLVIGNAKENQIFVNQGDGTFLAQRGDSVWGEPKLTSSIAVADVTGDHLPDIIEINYVDDPSVFEPIRYDDDGNPLTLPAPRHFHPAIDRVFVSQANGMLKGTVLGNAEMPSPSTGLGLLVTDIDGVPGNEVFVANDQNANQYWRRTDGQRFVDRALLSGVALSVTGKPLACMGIAAADFDRNQRLDFHISNYLDEWSNLYLQSDQGTFVDRAVAFGLDVPTGPMLGFGTQVVDYDNDGAADLVIGNGHIEDLRERGVAFQMPTQLLSLGENGYERVKARGDDEYWNSRHLSRAVARCDWNADGRVDFVATDLFEPSALMTNQTKTDSHFVQLRLIGTRSSRDAVGTQVYVEGARATAFSVTQTGDGYLCKNESVVFVGLGADERVRRLRVRWPNGQEQEFQLPGIDARWTLIEGREEAWLQWAR